MLLSHMVDERAGQAPDHLAYRIDGTSISYSDLAMRSSQVANWLMDLGIKKGDRVGIFMSKSLEIPITLSAIWKAGAAFVPIDPASPPQRVQAILNDCNITLIFADRARRRVLQKLKGLRIIIGLEPGEIDAPITLSWDSADSFSTTRPDLALASSDLAYIMYTSGSTGAPKGLMHTHHSGMSYARLSGALYEVQPTDRLTNHSPLHFDMSTFEYLTAPLHGASTIIVSEATSMFPTALAELIENEQVTFWYSVPLALTQMLLRGGLSERNIGSLRWVLYGGEPFPIKHLRRLMTLCPNARFSNVYGPAEVNQCTYFHFDHPPKKDDQPIPIGQTWAETEHRIMDEREQPVTKGELWIHSSTMMQGYWNQPDLTAEKFRNLDGKCFYRTGDLIEEKDDLLWFMGRMDRQIKTRGYRVELDEVESAVLAHDAVDETAVISCPHPEDDTLKIIAFVVLNRKDVDNAELKRAASERLPAYAVPEAWHVIAQFPKTGSGKVDRNALLANLNGS